MNCNSQEAGSGGGGGWTRHLFCLKQWEREQPGRRATLQPPHQAWSHPPFRWSGAGVHPFKDGTSTSWLISGVVDTSFDPSKRHYFLHGSTVGRDFAFHCIILCFCQHFLLKAEALFCFSPLLLALKLKSQKHENDVPRDHFPAELSVLTGVKN